ncbi:uncharacterized protein LOC117898039 [Drosophila subobscura]|uniref:uncharacterized protein LOC117898039 n=1 Tax=Drosophila subobscura TaxID=7241 RepID=UPI00155A85CB|nr:uncharacterized protein LOC117898039 [Drosophila subobscura]
MSSANKNAVDIPQKRDNEKVEDEVPPCKKVKLDNDVQTAVPQSPTEKTPIDMQSDNFEDKADKKTQADTKLEDTPKQSGAHPKDSLLPKMWPQQNKGEAEGDGGQGKTGTLQLLATQPPEGIKHTFSFEAMKHSLVESRVLHATSKEEESTKCCRFHRAKPEAGKVTQSANARIARRERQNEANKKAAYENILAFMSEKKVISTLMKPHHNPKIRLTDVRMGISSKAKHLQFKNMTFVFEDGGEEDISHLF